jgi:inner membrane protein
VLLRVLAPVGALAAVCGLDALLAARGWSLPAEAVLDWTAHLLTAWLVLSALGVTGSRAAAWALAGSVLIDLDHVPLYLGAEISAGGGRPVTHSLATALVLLAVAGAWRRGRVPVAGLALGVALHLLRDVALGPGVPLLWPLVQDSVRVPWPVYGGVLAVVTAVACVRACRPLRTGGPRPADRRAR